MKSIKKIHKPVYAPIDDLITYRVIPTASIEYLDPFLFLNHHGPQTYKSNNHGLPFGPHPHRGIETVTFILEGDILHKDNSGHESVIKEGGIQWMSAGKGLIHSETSSSHFKENGGPMEILQLWINMPAAQKGNKPFYKGLQKEDIPHIDMFHDQARVNVIAGKFLGIKGPFEPGIDLNLSTIYANAKCHFQFNIGKERNIFFYVISGKLKINGSIADAMSLVELNNDGYILDIEILEDSKIILSDAIPLNEPVVAQGPFVMNTQEEIYQAYEDYRNGLFGGWDQE